MHSRNGLRILIFSFLLGVAVQAADKKIIKAGPELGLPFSPAVKAGNFIHVAGAVATDKNGRLVPGDIKAQTRQTLENLSHILQAGGSTLSNAASLNVYLKSAADFPAMNEVYRDYWPKDPPVRTTVIANLVLPDALIEIAMVAVPKGGERRVIHPPDWIQSPSPYSYGIKSGDTLFLSGLVSRNGKDNSVITGDTAMQTRTIMDNAGEILKAAGMSHADVVSSRVYITDVAHFQEMNGAYRSYFPKDRPARATVKTGLAGPQYSVEITMVAVRGPAREALTTPNADGTPGTPNPNLSSGIRVGNRLYLSGMLGNTEGNRGDIKAQTRETLSRIGRTLKGAGFDWGDVVDGMVYITDVKNFGAMNEAYREVFKKDFPARATVETGLVNPDGLVEIMFTAVK
ncbi:MAG TPA: RidA family protein [Acidobacteriota bacterium]|jgi:reactive intermediate/imine deaminase|nr:RidA family protein [Acidobacteriota bacterium]